MVSVQFGIAICELIFHSKRGFYKDFVRKLELKEFQLF